MCDYDCLNCQYSDCINDDNLELDNLELDEYLDEQAAEHMPNKSKYRYAKSEAGKAAQRRYNHSEKGKARTYAYNHSDKRKEANRRSYLKRKEKLCQN